MATRYGFFVDGFNLYHALQADKSLRRYKWLDLKKLCSLFLPKTAEVSLVNYFTAYTIWDQEKVRRHKTYVAALEATGVDTILGKFKWKQRKCRKCLQTYETYEEKQTDVNIAIEVFRASMKNKFDQAIIVSGDSDLIPSIRAARSAFPTKKFGLIIPIFRRAEDLKQSVHFHQKMKRKHLESSQFVDVINLPDGTQLQRPSSWK
ncbi:MAG: NYN domain-containing protein [Elusimicrobia bacterium]|nr:MAG: NYN domain-containing protein [Elusimicrobiota bacterium]